MWIYKEKFLSLFWCFSPEKASQKESLWQGTGGVVDLLLVGGGRSPGFPLRFLNTWRGGPHECRVGMGVLSPHVASTNTELRVALLLLDDGENLESPPVLFWHHPSWEGQRWTWVRALHVVSSDTAEGADAHSWPSRRKTWIPTQPSLYSLVGC